MGATDLEGGFLASAWASLEDHEKDKREYIYSLEALSGVMP